VLAGATERGERPLVLLAGHFDTVPAQGNRPGRRDAEAVHGLGAADMKGAVAVMVELALAGVEATIDLGYVLFGREELAVTESALAGLLEREPGLRSADLVLVHGAHANAVHAGCLGNVNATWTFRGRSGTPRAPWLADNAIHRAAAGIHALAQVPPDAREFDGLRFTEVVSVTRVAGGIADNVVPAEASRTSTTATPPTAAPTRPRRGCATCASRTARWPSTAMRPAPRWRSPTRWPSA
jgi:succinyl-diaminopimelate desuccinylase